MRVLTTSWDHVDTSPGKLGDTWDVHATSNKIIFCSPDGVRPDVEIAEHIGSGETAAYVFAAEPAQGTTSIQALMLAVRERINRKRLGIDARMVMAGGAAFDGRQIWDVCFALLGDAGPVAWRVQHLSFGAILHLSGSTWRAAVMSLNPSFWQDGAPCILATESQVAETARSADSGAPPSASSP